LSDLIQSKSVLEDYIQMLLQLHDSAPDIFYQSTALLLGFKASMEAMTLVVADVIFAALDLFRNIFSHECLFPDARRASPPKFPVYAAAVNAVFEKEGLQFLTYLLQGLVGEFPEESISTVVTIFRNIASLWGNQLLVWLPPVLEQLPTATVPDQVKSQFLTEVAT
jgi:transportin-3